jgi:glutamyl-tRNA synthetase
MISVRIAVTPRAPLTIGALRAALANDLFRRSHNGSLTLRFDDLDERCSLGVADQIEQDLAWSGIEWQARIRQSDRRELYEDAIERLKRDRLLYPCFESDEELRAKEAYRRRRKQSPIYDRAMLAMTPAQRREAEAKGKRPYWRLKLPPGSFSWSDLIQGRRQVDFASVSDPILVHADGTPAPLLASAIDDADTHTTHLIRTEDSLGNTAIQAVLLSVLSGARSHVRFGHLPAPTDLHPAPGFRHLGSMAIRNLRHDGVEPRAIVVCLTGADSPASSPLDLTLTAFADGRLDVQRLLAVNRLVLREMSFADVADRLPGAATDAFWRAIRGHIDLLREARGWWDVVTGTIVPPVIEDGHEVLRAAATLLPPEPWDLDILQRWMSAISEATGRTKDELDDSLRLALTGEVDGPDLGDLLPLVGRPRAVQRLLIAAA